MPPTWHCWKKASKKLACDVDELIVSIYHYFEHSDVRKLQYDIIQQIHGADVKAAIKHVTSRWLSLHTVLPYYLTYWTPLRAFFKDERDTALGEEKKLKERLKKPNTNKSTESRTELSKKQVKKCNKVKFIYESLSEKSVRLSAEFLNFVLEPIIKFNLILQENEPCVQKADQWLESLIRELQSGFLKASAVRGQLPSSVVHTTKYNQKPDNEIMIGGGPWEKNWPPWLLTVSSPWPKWSQPAVTEPWPGPWLSCDLAVTEPWSYWRCRDWAVTELWPRRDWAVTSPSRDWAVIIGPGAVTTVVTVSSRWQFFSHGGAKNYIKEKKPSSSTLSIFIFNSDREYYVTLLDYLKGPLRQRVGIKCLKEAAVADTTRQDIASFTSVEFFINKYPQLLRNIGCQSQDLEREFNLYKGYEFPLFITQDSTVKNRNCVQETRVWAPG